MTINKRNNYPPSGSYKIVGIIQARMGSARLPGKMMMDLCGFPVLQWVLERCLRSKELDDVVLATTTSPEDDLLVVLAQKLGIETFRGDEHNVLNRYISAAKRYKATVVVRICGDRPLISPLEIDRLVKFYLNSNVDYACNHISILGNNYPDSIGAEICSVKILENIKQTTREERYLEHVTLYLLEHQELFKVMTFPCPEPYNKQEIRLVIDTLQDLMSVREICKHLSFESTPTDIFKQWSRYSKK